jgi:hypothetical protein
LRCRAVSGATRITLADRSPDTKSGYCRGVRVRSVASGGQAKRMGV